MDLRIEEISPGLGATVEGWVPGEALDDDAVAALRAAFDRSGVLVLRDETHMTSAFSTTLGPYLYTAVDAALARFAAP